MGGFRGWMQEVDAGGGCRRRMQGVDAGGWMQRVDARCGCRGWMQEVDAGGGCRGWMQGVDAGGVQVDPPGWLRAPYNAGPRIGGRAPRGAFSAKRPRSGGRPQADQRRQNGARPEAGTPGGGVRGVGGRGWRQGMEAGGGGRIRWPQSLP